MQRFGIVESRHKLCWRLSDRPASSSNSGNRARSKLLPPTRSTSAGAVTKPCTDSNGGRLTSTLAQGWIADMSLLQGKSWAYLVPTSSRHSSVTPEKAMSNLTDIHKGLLFLHGHVAAPPVQDGCQARHQRGP